MKQILSWSTVAVAAALLAACSSTPLNPPAPVTTATPTPTAPAAAPSPPASPAPTPSRTTLPDYLDPNSSISAKRSVYFDFDDFTIKNEYTDVVALHGKYLNPHPDLHIRIEGNADERGSAEYNLALGQKRAEAVARALKVYGVKDTQMEAVSFGSEKPKATGHDESAWAQNRRADVVYPRQ
jgi:peptidoglycan-associated lipoprotein